MRGSTDSTASPERRAGQVTAAGPGFPGRQARLRGRFRNLVVLVATGTATHDDALRLQMTWLGVRSFVLDPLELVPPEMMRPAGRYVETCEHQRESEPPFDQASLSSV